MPHDPAVASTLSVPAPPPAAVSVPVPPAAEVAQYQAVHVQVLQPMAPLPPPPVAAVPAEFAPPPPTLQLHAGYVW